MKIVHIFAWFSLLILIRSTIEKSIEKFYNSSDLPLLFTSPIKISTIFLKKIVELIASNLPNFVVWFMSPTIAFGIILGLPLNFYFVAIPVIFIQLITVTSQITIALLLLSRFLKFFRIFSLSITALIILLLIISFSAFNSLEKISELILGRNFPENSFANFLIDWHLSREISFHHIGKILAESIVSFLSAIFLASQIYQESWERSKGAPIGIIVKIPIFHKITWNSSFRSMMIKDFLIFIRRAELGTTFVALSSAIAITLFLLKNESYRSISPFAIGSEIMAYSTILTLGLTWSGYRSDREMSQFLNSSPLRKSEVFWSKFFVATFCAILYNSFWQSILLRPILKIPIGSFVAILTASNLLLMATNSVNIAFGKLPWIGGSSDDHSILVAITAFFAILVNAIILILPAIGFQIIVW